MDQQKAREAGISEASTAILVLTPSCYQAKLVYFLSLSSKKKTKTLNQTNKQKLILMLRGRRGEGRRNFM